MANDSNLSMRIDRHIKARLDAAARIMEEPLSRIVEDVLGHALEEVEARAEAVRLSRGGLQVSPTALEDALRAFMTAVTDGTPLRVHPSELYGPESKALWVLLSWIWENDDGNEKAKKKLAAVLESVNIKPTLVPPPPKPDIKIPPPKPIKHYARKNTD